MIYDNEALKRITKYRKKYKIGRKYENSNIISIVKPFERDERVISRIYGEGY